MFAPHNLIRDAPFTKLDLITCRNLLIYFQPHAQKTVLSLFHFALKTGGFLFLGSSESPGGLLDEFDTIDEHGKIYRKRRDIGLPRDLKLPLPRSRRVPRGCRRRRRSGTAVSPQLLATYDRLLDRFMPPSFLVDEHGQLVDSFGGAESLLKIKARRPVAEPARAARATSCGRGRPGALHRVRARRRERPLRRRARCRRSPGRFSLVAEPLTRRARRADARPDLVRRRRRGDGAAARPAPFADVPPPRVEPAPAARRRSRGGSRAIDMHALEDELSYTKENLQATIEELETANEELQATNEELVASNEELQSTNEELHSVNEELYTVNAEYQKKNVELQELNDDIEHLLNGTDVATMFLDRELCIRKFTPRIAEIFHVIPHDIGRPLADFTHNLLYADADGRHRARAAGRHDRRGADLGHAAAAATSCGSCPYRGRPQEPATAVRRRRPSRSAPDGVVLTLTDISALEQARARLAQLSAIVESSDDAIIGKTLDGIVTSWNNGATRLYGYTAEEAIGRHVELPVAARAARTRSTASCARSATGGRSSGSRRRGVRKDGSLVDVSVTFSPIFDAADAIVGVSAISRDITQLVARATGDRRARRADPAAARLDRRGDLRHRSERRLHLLQRRLRAPARLRLARRR